MPAVGPIPDWDDPDDIRWGLFPFALFRGIASMILGYDPVAERHRRKMAKESQESFERLASLEHEAYDNLQARHRGQGTEPTSGG